MSLVGHVTWKYILFSDLKTVEVFTIFGSENLGSVHYFRIWKHWKCILFSDLKTLEVYTMFGSENPGIVYDFRIWKPWKCSLSSDLKTMEAVTIFGSENCGGPIFDAILWVGSGGEAAQESRWVWGAARHPNEGDGRGGGWYHLGGWSRLGWQLA